MVNIKIIITSGIVTAIELIKKFLEACLSTGYKIQQTIRGIIMLSKPISIAIYNSNNRLLKRFKRKSASSVAWTYDMFNGIRTLDLTQELKRFIDSGLLFEKQPHSLFCTYIKFGETQQERVNFTVIFEHCK